MRPKLNQLITFAKLVFTLLDFLTIQNRFFNIQIFINMMTTKDIRNSFLDFFASKQHKIVPSAPMVVKNDPTLMFTNAGMNPFKDIFLGNANAKDVRVADSQKCLRVSGKHNDLEEVGHDTYHHTMFEMLGNWSFGDYFKKEAIEWAWEYLTEILKIDKDRLYVTVFEGSKDDGLGLDTEARDFWKKYIDESRILFGNKKDNFWEMGDTGPCGPCSEIHYDSRPDKERELVSGCGLVNKDDPQVIEIWNLVFMQYNRKASGELEKLPACHVDTGMGFERLCRVVQKRSSNYDIDLFRDIINAVGSLTGKQYGCKEDTDVAMRVVADHLRAIAFSIADGQIPSNNKAGYVIRRLLRRAVRYGYTFLDRNEPFIHALVPTLINVMGDSYPELEAQKDLIIKVIKEEENSFLRTLDTGIRLIDTIINKAIEEGKTEINGDVVFELYDTFGFPLDLTELILREKNLTYNRKEYETCLEAQKQRSRADASVDTGDWIEVFPCEESVFVGYDTLSANVRISRYRKVKSKGKEYFQLVFNTTPFYAESGGQMGDKGVIKQGSSEWKIFDTKKENNLNIHYLTSLPESLNGNFEAIVDEDNRKRTESNHTATHLLHKALRIVLGTHVEQRGSFVSAEYLRFDFSHFQKMTEEEIEITEKLVNSFIRKNSVRDEKRSIPIQNARDMGAMALFGEKYGDRVRMIKFDDSVELCGGTHVASTGEIGYFKIGSESAVAAGIRRIEAYTGEGAESILAKANDLFKEIKSLFPSSPNVLVAIKKMIADNQEMKANAESFLNIQAASIKDRLMKSAIQLPGGISLMEWNSSEATPELVKNIAFMLREESGRFAFTAGRNATGKPELSVMISDELISEGRNASKMIREAALEIGGNGGGQPFFATAGGKNANGVSAALENLKIQLTVN